MMIYFEDGRPRSGIESWNDRDRTSVLTFLSAVNQVRLVLLALQKQEGRIAFRASHGSCAPLVVLYYF